jgi:hypothetical protein
MTERRIIRSVTLIMSSVVTSCRATFYEKKALCSVFKTF